MVLNLTRPIHVEVQLPSHQIKLSKGESLHLIFPSDDPDPQSHNAI
jgi:hypothetical protein